MFGKTSLRWRLIKRNIRQSLSGKSGSLDGPIFQHHTQIYERIFPSLQLFYGLIFFVSLSYHLSELEVSQYVSMNPPASFAFIKLFPRQYLQATINLIPVAILLAFIRPQSWYLRFLASIAFLIGYAYRCSFGVNYHAEMGMSWGALALLLVPDISTKFKTNRVKRHQVIVGYWIFLAAFIYTYFLAGLWKLIWGAGVNIFNSGISFWNIKSMSYVVANYLSTIGEASWLGDFIINHPLLGWPLIWGGIIVEHIVLLPLFRPKWWRPVTLLLITLHLLSMWILAINFWYNFLFLVIIMYSNPFSQKSVWLQGKAKA